MEQIFREEVDSMLYRGGQEVEKGTYWNLMNGERKDMEQCGMLAGDAGTRYLRAPGAALLVLGPVFGLLFAMFLPFIGIAMTISLLFKKIGGTVADMAAQSVSFGWRPAASYLSGRNKKKKAAKKSDEAGPAS
jgi:hypothetical protein